MTLFRVGLNAVNVISVYGTYKLIPIVGFAYCILVVTLHMVGVGPSRD